MASKAKAKKVAPPPKGAVSSKKKTEKKNFHTEHPHLFNKDARDYRIGRDIQPKRDLSRFVKWPRYVRLQRQRKILTQRLKVPPAINHFTATLEKNQAANLFRLLARYRPESKEEKKARRAKKAEKEVKGDAKDESKKPKVIKYGLNHVTTLIENKKAKLVIIAHDVDPIELVVWLPALCRKMEVPYVIVKDKARLGHLVYKKTATVLAITDVQKEHQRDLDTIISATKSQYIDMDPRKVRTGGGLMGIKAQHEQRIRERSMAREQASKAKA